MTELVEDLRGALPVTAVGNLALAGLGLVLVGLGILGWVLAGRQRADSPVASPGGVRGQRRARQRPRSGYAGTTPPRQGRPAGRRGRRPTVTDR